MDKPSSSSSSSSFSFSSSILLSRSPAIDRHNPIITDSRRSLPSPTHIPPRVTTKPQHHKKNKNINTITTTTNNNNNSKQKNIPTKENEKRADKNARKPDVEKNVRISPSGSTRYLLSESVLFDDLSNFDLAQKIFSAQKAKDEDEKVVVLRVSLHCRGCERKMRKHLSRMQGVKAFNIDFTAKKVTVTGNITPLEVFSSISKVKYAQLWSPAMTSSSSSSASPPINFMSNSEFKNVFKGSLSVG
ncbi:heavy metal transport/detoxification superfamily protein [Striga asiatica]|uniref:Heavy metal transport/detoxification superfamily protein n=1 Tax=Striga asiatica TaxID=4170 RepID=A0A5A7P7W3_STRAF|nr:heavy metal transport/detoxification superfamily protein [Striga asiatica]